MATQVPFRLQYSLSRSQRPELYARMHLRWWSILFIPFCLAVLTFFVWQAIESAWRRDACGVAVFGGLTLLPLLHVLGLFESLLDVLIVPVRHMDVEVEENGAGVLLGRERWWLFLDGFTDLTRFRADTWTLEHFNGCVLHITASAISDDQLNHIRAAMRRGRTPEGIRAVIERGKQIEEIRKRGRWA
jgi:hypothetical protein